MKIKWKKKEEPVPIDWDSEVTRLTAELAYAQLMQQVTKPLNPGLTTYYPTQIYTNSPIYYSTGINTTTTNLTSILKQTI